MSEVTYRRIALSAMLACLITLPANADRLCPIQDMGAHLDASWVDRYAEHPFSELSRDYFRFYRRDTKATPGDHELLLDASWRIAVPDAAAPLTRRMAEDLRLFLAERMGLSLPLTEGPRSVLQTAHDRLIVALDDDRSGDEAESFRLEVSSGHVRIAAGTPEGVRAGVVRLVNEMGLRRAPMVALGSREFQPRQRVRVGRAPLFGTYRDVAFQGNNAVVLGHTNLYAVSESERIPQLAKLRDRSLIERVRDNVREAHQYGLRTYLHVNTQLFDDDAPLFVACPDLRGAELQFGKPRRFVLCCENPSVRAYLKESMELLFRTTQLDGVLLIVGGEEFYHCFMRAVDRTADRSESPQHPLPIHTDGRTNCARCDALGADVVVANLVNCLATGAQRANPHAEVVAWPYSATYFWSPDNTQAEFIRQLRAGTAVLTEPEKEAYVDKPNGIRKSLWDYSIDLIEPGERARAQLEAARRTGVPLYFKSDHEHAYEAPRLPYIPCVDRWWDRSAALAASGADGSWVFSYVYRPSFGTTGTRIAQWLWWDPVPSKEDTLQQIACCIAGPEGGPHLRNAWQLVSQAIGHDPGFLSEYFHGPSFLGPEHPMLADPDADLPDLFFVRQTRDNTPVFDDYPRGDVKAFATAYAEMRKSLQQALQELDAAEARVNDRDRVVFDAEATTIRFFCHTVRTQENYCQSFLLRNRLLTLLAGDSVAADRREEASRTFVQWRAVLEDELQNARAALPVAECDPRLYQLTAFSSGPETLRTKINILRHELEIFLPDLARRHSLTPP